MVRVILLGNRQPDSAREIVSQLAREMATFCEVVWEDFSESQIVPPLDADLAIVFGGDGAIIRAAHQMGTRQLPIIAVHLGTLGFLSMVRTEEILPLLRRDDLLTFAVVEHLLLRCCVYDENQNLLTERICLNEISIQSGRPFRLTHIELLIDDEPVTVYRCDGLILSTPIGSTAHHLSAGGPILRKDLHAVSICPISPHTLSHRPVIDSPDRRYTLRVLDRQAAVIIDGVEVALIDSTHRVEVTRSPMTFKMLKLPHYSYYQTLRDKLGWSGSIKE